MKTTTSSSGSVAVLLVAMLAVHAAVGDISCPEVVNDLSPCQDYLLYNAAEPSNQCCDVVRAAYKATDTVTARQDTCRCLKAADNQFHAQLSAAQQLPGKCSVQLSVRISPDIDCDMVE